MSNQQKERPHRPEHLSRYAEICLDRLAANGLGDKISLGGALGLLHYLDYRPTHDADAWWSPQATQQDRAKVVKAIEMALEAFGQVNTRQWGDVVSVELLEEGRRTFSFQIAERSAQLEPSQKALWTNVLLDSFADLVASKMVALIERGAPRDFRDIYAICEAHLITPSECWALWRRRQKLADSDTDHQRARLALETHLARITVHRPLNQIADPDQRTQAEQVREWYREVFLDAFRSSS